MYVYTYMISHIDLSSFALAWRTSGERITDHGSIEGTSIQREDLARVNNNNNSNDDNNNNDNNDDNNYANDINSNVTTTNNNNNNTAINNNDNV